MDRLWREPGGHRLAQSPEEPKGGMEERKGLGGGCLLLLRYSKQDHTYKRLDGDQEAEKCLTVGMSGRHQNPALGVCVCVCSEETIEVSDEQ